MGNIRYILIILSFLTAIIISLEIPNSLLLLLGFELILYMSLVTCDFFFEKRLTLFQVWIAAFVFVILSEMIVISYEEGNILPYITPIVFLLSANNIVLLSYLITRTKIKSSKNIYILGKPKYFPIVIWLLIFFYVFSNAYILQKALYMGVRGGGGSSLGTFDFLSTLTKGFGQLLPALIAYYYTYCKKNSKWEGVIAVAPILLLQLLMGSRFSFLFSILPYLLISDIVNFEKFTFKKIVVTIFVLLGLVYASNLVKEFRSISLLDYISQSSKQKGNDNSPLIVKFANEMSPEGVVYMTKLSDDYFSSHEYHYGKESGYIFYFWIPRSIWPSKPTQLDHWLIREYVLVADNYSSASGFVGELKADFGYFSLFVMLFLGGLLKRADSFVNSNLSRRENSFTKVIAAATIPYVFFFVRSPLTSSYSFLFEIVFFLILRSCFFKEINTRITRIN